jgi:hypothetical protein
MEGMEAARAVPGLGQLVETAALRERDVLLLLATAGESGIDAANRKTRQPTRQKIKTREARGVWEVYIDFPPYRISLSHEKE